METLLQNLQTELNVWSEKKFGEGKIIPKAKHLKKEVDELIKALESFENASSDDEFEKANYNVCEEVADCFLLILDIAARHGINSYKLIKLAECKLGIAKTRKYKKPDKDGIIEHIKD